jgi:hypothetical protein
MELMREQDDQREEPEQAQSGALDGPSRPLPLSLWSFARRRDPIPIVVCQKRRQGQRQPRYTGDAQRPA